MLPIHTKLHAHVNRKRVHERGGVRCSVWCATIIRTSLVDVRQILHLSWTQCSSLSSLRSHHFREAVSNLLTVTMHLQDALSKFHCPSLHGVDLRVHMTSASTRSLTLHESQQMSSCTYCSTGLSLRYPRKLHQPVPSTRTHQNSGKPCSVSWKKRTQDARVFNP